MDGVEREFEAIGNAELIEDVVQMVFHRLLADEELFADFLIAETLGDELHDFFFAIAEERLFAARARLGRFREGFHDFSGHAIVEPDFSGMNAVMLVAQCAVLVALSPMLSGVALALLVPKSLRAMIISSAMYLSFTLTGAYLGGAVGTVRGAALATCSGAVVWWWHLRVAMRESDKIPARAPGRFGRRGGGSGPPAAVPAEAPVPALSGAAGAAERPSPRSGDQG